MALPQLLMWWYWDPNPELFRIPWIDRPVFWYGFLFALGFAFGYSLFVPLLARALQCSSSKDCLSLRSESYRLTDRLMWYVILGTLIGARLGHVFLYNWPSYRDRWIDIFKIWEGGLASHGGAIGVLIALFLFQKKIARDYPQLTFLALLDMICIPTALVGCFIRIGNFINQEILGVPTELPWGVFFGHPIDSSVPIPRHPVQLYEASAYLLIFISLIALWKYRPHLHTGTISGLFFTALFSARCLLESYKMPQSEIFDESNWMTGQLLSLPFIAAGIALLIYSLQLNAKKQIKT